MTRLIIAGILSITLLLTVHNVDAATIDQTDESSVHVMLSILGQTGDTSFDVAWDKVKDACVVLAVIDNENDPISPYIHTNVTCAMTQSRIDNLGEQLGDSLLNIAPLYTTYIPAINN